MNLSPSLEIHPHQEFHFAENTDSSGSCCCWKSKTVKPKEYMVDAQNRLHGRQKLNMHERIVANQRLGSIIRAKFEQDPIENDLAFERLRAKLRDSNDENPVTPDRLVEIVNAMYDLKREISRPGIRLDRVEDPRLISEYLPEQNRGRVVSRNGIPLSRTENDLAESSVVKKRKRSRSKKRSTVEDMVPRTYGHRDLHTAHRLPSIHDSEE